MPLPVLVFAASPILPNPPFHFGTVTLLLYLPPSPGYLSGNIPIRNAYSAKKEHLSADSARNQFSEFVEDTRRNVRKENHDRRG